MSTVKQQFPPDAIEGTPFTVALRSGVTFPDWSAITSQTARDALAAIFEVENIERRWRNYAPAEIHKEGVKP